MPRPLYAYATYRRYYEWDCGRPCTITERTSIAYFASEAGARAAARFAGSEWDDYESFGQIEKLQPGTVYDHYANAWVQGLAYQPWYGDAWAARVERDLDEDYVPF